MAIAEKSRSEFSTNDPTSHLHAYRPAALWIRLLVVVGVLSLTVLAFLPVLENGFVDLDDPEYLIENPACHGLRAANLRWMFTVFFSGDYLPVSWLTHGLDFSVWGMNAGGHHLTSLILHAAAAGVFCLVIAKILRIAAAASLDPEQPRPMSDAKIWIAAGLGALVFAVHPLRVEPVAWATARDFSLSALFLLLSVSAYLAAAGVGGNKPRAYRRRLGASIAFFIPALLSNQAVVTLPAVLLILDVYPLRRLRGRPSRWLRKEMRSVLWEKVPYIVLALLNGVFAWSLRVRAGEWMPMESSNLPIRVARAFHGVVFYLWKSIAPFRLLVHYRFSSETSPWAPLFVLSAVFVVGVTLCLIAVRRRAPWALAAWIAYGVMLSPFLTFQLPADRYSYYCCMAWAVLVGAGVLSLWRAGANGRIGRRTLLLGLVSVMVAVASLGVLTWRQTKVWRDPSSLWTYTLKRDPEWSYAFINRGSALMKENQLERAADHFRQAIRLDPDDPRPNYNLGFIHARKGELDNAVSEYEKSIALAPEFASAYHDLASVYMENGKFDAAIETCRRAIESDLRLEIMYSTLGLAHMRKGDNASAADAFAEAARANPKSARPHYNLASIHAGMQETELAIAEYKEAIRLNPFYAMAYNNLAVTYLNTWDFDSAVSTCRKAIRCGLKDHMLYNTLGTAYLNKGDLGGAIGAFRKAIRIRPSFAPAYFNLADAQLEVGDIQAAVKVYKEAIADLPNPGEAHAGLARLYWRIRDVDRAREHARRAQELGVKIAPALLREIETPKRGGQLP